MIHNRGGKDVLTFRVTLPFGCHALLEQAEILVIADSAFAGLCVAPAESMRAGQEHKGTEKKQLQSLFHSYHHTGTLKCPSCPCGLAAVS